MRWRTAVWIRHNLAHKQALGQVKELYEPSYTLEFEDEHVLVEWLLADPWEGNFVLVTKKNQQKNFSTPDL
jgi:hypothetical protein